MTKLRTGQQRSNKQSMKVKGIKFHQLKMPSLNEHDQEWISHLKDAPHASSPCHKFWKAGRNSNKLK
jgi:hypothetical protein